MEELRSMEKGEQGRSWGGRDSGRGEFHYTIVALTSNFSSNQRADWILVVEHGQYFL